jgi:hypothetical protein
MVRACQHPTGQSVLHVVHHLLFSYATHQLNTAAGPAVKQKMHTNLGQDTPVAMLCCAAGMTWTQLNCCCIHMNITIGPLAVTAAAAASAAPRQFGSGLSAADLMSTRGYLQNLATWLILQLRPLLAATRNDPWLAARQQLGLPGSTSSCPLANAVSWLRGARQFEQCESLVDVVLGSWVLEHARGLQENQVGY